MHLCYVIKFVSDMDRAVAFHRDARGPKPLFALDPTNFDALLHALENPPDPRVEAAIADAAGASVASVELNPIRSFRAKSRDEVELTFNILSPC